jgi:cytochrome c5
MRTNRSSRRGPHRARGWGLPLGVAASGLVLAGLVLGGCAPGGTSTGEQASSDKMIVPRADSFIVDLAGPQFARLSQAQRWRAVASLGTGLPPSGFEASDLPEPRSTGAGLLQAYCVQCHWLPTPQMHSAMEWPILLRRMALRMSLLEKRVQGPFLERVGGEALRSAVTFRSVPTADQLDSLQAYLTRNALPVAKSGEIPAGAEAALFRTRCTVCHQTPSPRAHTAAGWGEVVPRMQQNMRLMQVDTLTTKDADGILSFLRAHAAAGGGD